MMALRSNRCLDLLCGVALVMVPAMHVARAEAASASAAPAPAIEWLRSEDAAFAKARAGKRFVLLDLEAVWCHWCHVMDEKTYADPAVIREVNAHYVALRIDQDARPDIAQRYGDYGWPATIFFAADGTEIVKKRGYIPADGFAHLLRVIVEDPSPVD
jgi:uncharacterized protein YyaL (SSP411 family)